MELRFLHFGRNDNDETAALSKLIRVRKPPQNGIVPRWSEIFDHATKYWIEQSAGMSHIEIERH
jgi:hypothetical protein